VAALLELHVATSQLLPVTSLAEVTQAVQTLMVLVGDITQDLHTVATNYRLDAGHVPHEQLDLRRQASVTGSDAARKYAQGVELLHQASAWLNHAHHDATLMADLTTTHASTAARKAPPPSSPDRTEPRSIGHPRRPDAEQDGPGL
jgi:hypothetical protein